MRHPLALAAVLVSLATPAQAGPPIELADVTAGIGGFAINAIDEGDQLASSVSGAGDVNGDGLADIVLGSDRAAEETGQCYVIFGRSSTDPVELTDVVAGVGGFVINAVSACDELGTSVSGVGDVNGDGLDDVIVGASWADPGGMELAGASYVVFGKVDGTPVELAEITAGAGGGFAINGADASTYSGTCVGGAGDVNGDGLDDVLVQAHAPTGALDVWPTAVVFGKADFAAVSLADIATGVGGGFIIHEPRATPVGGTDVGTTCESEFVFLVATRCAGIGDLNDDGLDDILVSSVFPDPDVRVAGATYVVFGKTDTNPVSALDIEAGLGGYVIYGLDDPEDWWGTVVAGAGDVNGDGLVDVIVGAVRGKPDGVNETGASYVIFGQSGTEPVELADVVAGVGGFAIHGADAVDRTGISVDGAGDVNGDGFDDLLVGAIGADPGGLLSAGATYLVYGKPGGPPVELADVEVGLGGVVINGAAERNSSGRAVAGAGDVNGDRVPDLLISAPRTGPVENWMGQCYVVFGIPCLADLDGSGDVGAAELLRVLQSWGSCGAPCPEDLTGDGNVDFADVLAVIAAWGPC